MKQNIIENQLNELSKEGLKRLQKWYLKHKEDKFGVPILSIGQMIEFLDEHGLNPKIEVRSQMGVCDSLWEAVKEVLNDN